jgi:hypothetical protein
LKNTAYIGNVQCSDVLYAGNHPPLVDQETWEQCQRIQRERNRGGRGHTHQDGWLLSRIVRCARCGEKMWTHPGGREGKHRYYYCAGRDHRTCQMPLIPAAPVEAQALALVKTLTLPQAWRERIVAQVARHCNEPPPKPAIDKTQVEQQIKRLAMAFSLGDIDEQTYRRQRDEWKRLLAEAEAPPATAVYNIQQVWEMLDSFASLIDAASEEEQRAMLRHLFTQVWLEPGQIVALTPTSLCAGLLAAIEVARETNDGERGCLTGPDISSSRRAMGSMRRCRST